MNGTWSNSIWRSIEVRSAPVSGHSPCVSRYLAPLFRFWSPATMDHLEQAGVPYMKETLLRYRLVRSKRKPCCAHLAALRRVASRCVSFCVAFVRLRCAASSYDRGAPSHIIGRRLDQFFQYILDVTDTCT